MSAGKAAASPPLFEEKEGGAPAEESVLRHLAQTLSVTKTLKRFSSLKPEDLQGILLRCAQRAEKKEEAIEAFPPRKEVPEFFIMADGASRGNPGEAGVGIVICDARGRTIKEIKQFLGTATNNVAEYQAAILAVKKALDLGAGSVVLSLDSELVARQLRGEYKVREAHLKPLHQQALELLSHFAKYDIQNIGREENRRADQLANEAIDQRIIGGTD